MGGWVRILDDPRRCVSSPSGSTAAPVCVSCGSSGWSVPGVSIQLTFSHKHLHSTCTLDSCKACGMTAKKQSFGVRRNPHLNLTFTLTLGLEKTPLFLEVSIARREALGGPCARRERL